MTQIVYDGSALYADPNSYYDLDTKYKVSKIRTKDITQDKRWIWASAGTYPDIACFDRIVESMFSTDVINYEKQTHKLDDDDGQYYNIFIEVTPHYHRVYLANYFGDLHAIEPGQFIAIGAYYQAIQTLKRTFDYLGIKKSTPEIMWLAVRGTHQEWDINECECVLL